MLGPENEEKVDRISFSDPESSSDEIQVNWWEIHLSCDILIKLDGSLYTQVFVGWISCLDLTRIRLFIHRIQFTHWRTILLCLLLAPVLSWIGCDFWTVDHDNANCTYLHGPHISLVDEAEFLQCWCWTSFQDSWTHHHCVCTRGMFLGFTCLDYLWDWNYMCFYFACDQVWNNK